MLVAVIMIVPGVMAAGMRMAHNAQDARKTLLQHLNHSAPDAPAPGSPMCASMACPGQDGLPGDERPERRDDPGRGGDGARHCRNRGSMTGGHAREAIPSATRRGAAGPIPDLVNRDFSAAAPGEKMAGDIIYIETWEGLAVPGHRDRPRDAQGNRLGDG